MIVKTYPVEFHPEDTVFCDCEKSHLLFFDIETTGLTARASCLYLIGAVYFQENEWRATQWFAETPLEESDLLKTFLDFASGFSQVIHFNGNHFDLPYLAEKCRAFSLPNTLSALISRDLYQMARPLKTLLQLSSLKQKSLEEFLGLHREDRYSGGELIAVYHRQVLHPSEDSRKLLLLHNFEDLLGMLAILPILSYRLVTDGKWNLTKCEAVEDTVIFRGTLPHALPKPLAFRSRSLFVGADGRALTFRVTGLRGTLKYFFPDYKNYYYLPLEDTAIHKSVAAYVDRDYREPAKASNCYSKKEGFYLPQDEALFEPVFREEYGSPALYFACTDRFLSDPSAWRRYLRQLLSSRL